MSFGFSDIISIIIGFLVAISVHECAHAWMANMLGDPTAKHEGRLSLNPLRHLDPLGTITLLLVHFGWGKPVPVNSNNLNHPLRDNALIALAGPMSNFITAAILAIPVKHLLPLWQGPGSTFVITTLAITVSINIVLMIFNLIPIPPLDGSKLLFLALGQKGIGISEWLERNGPPLLFATIILGNFIGFPIISYIISKPVDAITALIYLAG